MHHYGCVDRSEAEVGMVGADQGAVWYRTGLLDYRDELFPEDEVETVADRVHEEVCVAMAGDL